jgi:hypothetical protein
VVIDEDDSPEVPTLLLDLRDIQVSVASQETDGQRDLALILTDGQSRVELTGGLSGSSEAAVAGAQRLASGALEYAVGLAMLAMPEANGGDQPC